MWRSLVAHFVRDEGAAGSNPVIPIVYLSLAKLFDRVAKLPSHQGVLALKAIIMIALIISDKILVVRI